MRSRQGTGRNDVATADAGLRRLLADSGEDRGWVSPRTDLVTALLGLWFGIGLMIDAWAHTNLPSELETFFTPWHAVFYSGFAAVAGWIIWQVLRNVRTGRQGVAAVPMGYLAGLVAIPAFAAFGFADMMWHTFLGIETSVDILFSPSHLGLVATMMLIVTTPLRSAWHAPDVGVRPSLWRLLPALVGLAFATTLVSLFLSYGDALQQGADDVVTAFSDLDRSVWLAPAMVITNVITLAPVLLLVRRWQPPFGRHDHGCGAGGRRAGVRRAQGRGDRPARAHRARRGRDLRGALPRAGGPGLAGTVPDLRRPVRGGAAAGRGPAHRCGRAARPGDAAGRRRRGRSDGRRDGRRLRTFRAARPARRRRPVRGHSPRRRPPVRPGPVRHGARAAGSGTGVHPDPRPGGRGHRAAGGRPRLPPRGARPPDRHQRGRPLL